MQCETQNNPSPQVPHQHALRCKHKQFQSALRNVHDTKSVANHGYEQGNLTYTNHFSIHKREMYFIVNKRLRATKSLNILYVSSLQPTFYNQIPALNMIFLFPPPKKKNVVHHILGLSAAERPFSFAWTSAIRAQAVCGSTFVGWM